MQASSGTPASKIASDRRSARSSRIDGGEQRTALVSIGAAAVLVVLKLGAGLITGSLGLISAGIESSGDIVAALLTFVAVRFGARPADPDHPYGHRRAENLAALGEAAILLTGGTIVAIEAIGRLSGGGEPLKARWYVFAVIVLALLIDASRVVVSARTSRLYRSAALRSNAFHFAGDMVGSLAVLVGLTLVSQGFEQGDSVAALVVACIIFAAAARLIWENAAVLMDRDPADAHGRAAEAIDALGPDIELRRLRLRESAGRYFADAVVEVPPGQALVAGHAAADQVEAAVQDALPDSDVVVHVEPRRHDLEVRDRVLAIALAEPLVREAHDITIYQRADRAIVTLHLKLPPELTLAEAHEVAERVEAAILKDPRVEAVKTHLEPLEQPLAIETAPLLGEAQTKAVRELVQNRLGQPPRALRVMPTGSGLVVLLTVGLGDRAALPDAHRIASELEEAVRQLEPGLAEVVVHTEP